MRERFIRPSSRTHVLEPLRGEHGGDGALLLEHGIGGDGGAVDEALDGRGGRARLREHAAHGDGHALEEILGRGGDLGQDEAALPVEGHDVGEGAADVDADLHVCGPLARVAILARPETPCRKAAKLDARAAEGDVRIPVNARWTGSDCLSHRLGNISMSAGGTLDACTRREGPWVERV